MKIKVVIVFGTRPEAIKLASLIILLKQDTRFELFVCVTGQHNEMLYQVLDLFAIKPDIDFRIMLPGQSLSILTSRLISSLSDYFLKLKPDIVLVQGDTTTAFCASLSSFYAQTPVGHIEAGLRTGNLYSPWPEEGNRTLISKIANFHFAPTILNKMNLLNEGIIEKNIFVTGNTVIDTLLMTVNKIILDPPYIKELPISLQPSTIGNKRIVLITGHRRESFGKGFKNICKAIAELAINFPDVYFVFPAHLNPNVQEPVNRYLNQKSLPKSGRNIYLIKPLDYLEFVALMNISHLIITDSGGIQEEAPSLGKPVLVIRDETERIEAVNSGTVKLIGTEQLSIVTETTFLLSNREAYEKMALATNPYGEGNSSKKIIEECYNLLKKKN